MAEELTGRGLRLSKIVLNKGEEDEMECMGYVRSIPLTILFVLLVILTGGVLFLVTHWRPDWRLKLTHKKSSLICASAVLLVVSFCVRSFRRKKLLQIIIRALIQQLTLEDAKKKKKKFPSQKLFLKFFDHRHVRYIWEKEEAIYKRLTGLDVGFSVQEIHDNAVGLSQEEQVFKILLFGENSIHIEVKSYFKLFIEEVLNPFYIFQICSVTLWALDNYYIYASCIVFISTVSMGIELYEIRKQRVTLRDMVDAVESTLTVVRPTGERDEVTTSQLVPGDVFIVPPRGCMMMCDAALITGNAIVNESMLTGESVPVTKTPLAPSEAEEMYTPDALKRHTLFSGTQVIQTRFYGGDDVKAVVVRTGFSTAKGELVRAILYPKAIGFKFYQDAMKFILFLTCIATIGMTYSIVTLVRYGTPVREVVLRALDIITIVVPPALPAAMTVGTVYAQSRLKKQGIFCISPPRINICGKLKCICFDKTGTLTEEGLDLWGIVPVKNSEFNAPETDPKNIPQTDHLQIGMAVCHSLTLIDGEISGDPLDLIMFNSISWVLKEPGSDTTKFDSLLPTIVKPIAKESYYLSDPDKVGVGAAVDIGIVRQFTFSSALQRMSVIVRPLGADYMSIYCKGSPEKVASLCRRDTLPEDFAEQLHKYTMKGFRVLGVAYRDLDPKLTWHQSQRIARDRVENDLCFVGLLIMENSLKPETRPVIRQLHEARIRTVMVTGDNLLTAISVARQCLMVGPKERVILVNAHPPENGTPARIHWEYADPEAEETDRTESDVETFNDFHNGHSVVHMQEESPYYFALSGRCFSVLRHHFPELMSKIIVRGTIFARMGPDQKSQLVEHLQELDYCVGMCGDGANDCGALKTAHAGISLSEAEASVASPFTSKTPNIECVLAVIREGRAALTTSFGVFKYMALYSLIQFISVLILYTMETNLGDWMFLYIDLVITTTIAVLMGHTAAYPHLVARRPAGSLVGPSNLISIITHIIIVCTIQISSFVYLTSQPWYEEIDRQSYHDNNVQTMVTTVIFYVSAFQYIMMAFIFSTGPPYRLPVYTNVLFTIALVVLSSMTAFLIIYPVDFLVNLLQVPVTPH
ncbi:hypothetical protein CAPTEDRAFT_90245 [Capitella teleta]|uniref:Cation-transporting ATPase n=1 Tax=Capitella teleta TaxID=283909 RepID=R7VA91_CAPTE|nr:hypothetical protein CAPTEDRAFT_90245 [Capitella teleta]|eukprot:ELU12635.1 hypothetical protein CAPTEDRAFT_90245 [Capitella teleta]